MSSSTAGSVTLMIRLLRAGDRGQVATLWDRYFERLARLASPFLRNGFLASGDHEDAALCAIHDFCGGIARGKFDYVDGREVLWSTLATIVERKAMQMARRWTTVSIEDLPPGSSTGTGGDVVLATIEPTPEYRALASLTLAELVGALDNPLWRQAVLLELEGYSVREIAARLGRSRECVFVWRRAIREIWREKLGGTDFLD